LNSAGIIATVQYSHVILIPGVHDCMHVLNNNTWEETEIQVYVLGTL